MAFYQIAVLYVQRVWGSKSAQKADEHDEDEHHDSEDEHDGETGYNQAIKEAIQRTYQELAKDDADTAESV